MESEAKIKERIGGVDAVLINHLLKDPFFSHFHGVFLTRGCRGPYFSKAFLNGVGVRGVVQRSDLWVGVTNLCKIKMNP